MAEEDATWRRLIRSPRSSGTIEPSRRCSATVFLPAASTSRQTRQPSRRPALPIVDLYVHQRTLLEGHARANRESVWNGRPISLIVLAEPLEVLDGTPVSRIELIPPVHQRVYRMGLEHLGVVVGEEFDEFSRVHRAALTGQQFQVPASTRSTCCSRTSPTRSSTGAPSSTSSRTRKGASRASARRRRGAAAAGHRHRPESAPALTQTAARLEVRGFSR